MIHRMRAKTDHRGTGGADRCFIEHQVVGQAFDQGLEMIRDPPAFVERSVLDAPDNGFRRDAALRDIPQRVATQPQGTQIQFLARHAPERFDHGIVPHTTAIQEPAGQKHRGRQSQSLQNRRGQ